MLASQLSILTHTNSECQDLYAMYFSSLRRYFLDIAPKPTHHVVAVDQPIIGYYDIEQIFYNSTESVSSRLSRALESITSDLVLFMYEDYVLYAPADVEKIQQFANTIQEDNRIGFIRLLQSGAPFDGLYNKDLYKIQPDASYFFSTQATIWRTSVLKKLMQMNLMQRPQSEQVLSPYLADICNLGLCVTAQGPAVGGHYDSVCFPYIATACVGKKWNISEYPQLVNILMDNNIDPSVRGVR
jgi:hypothetical protein